MKWLRQSLLENEEVLDIFLDHTKYGSLRVNMFTGGPEGPWIRK